MGVNIYPADWENISLFQESSVKARIGWQGLTAKEYLNQGPYGLVGGTDLISGFINWDSISYVEKYRFDQDTNIQLLKNDILVTKDGTIGKVAIVDRLPQPSTLNSGVYVIRPINNRYDSKFIYYLLTSNVFSAFIDRLAAGSTISHLYQRDLKDFNVTIPKSNKEQRAIAKALSDIDELIETLVKEENKHRYIKEGLLGQIDDKFSVTNLLKDCVASPVTDGPHLTPAFCSSGVPFLSVNNIVDNKIFWENLRYISESDDLEFSRKCKPKKFDILLGKAASVGKVAIVDSDTDFNVWSPLAVIRMNEKYDPYFVYFCFQTKTVMNQITFLTNSSSQGNIGMGDIENIHLPMIEKSEQTRLGNLLKDEDNQIEGISKLRHKYECIKQGMAHDLLTGKVRLV